MGLLFKEKNKEKIITKFKNYCKKHLKYKKYFTKILFKLTEIEL